MNYDPLTLEDLLSVRQPGAPLWAADGRKLVCEIAVADCEADTTGIGLHLFDQSGRSQPLLEGYDRGGNPVRHRLPRWAPDGREIAFISDRAGVSGLWLMQFEQMPELLLQCGERIGVLAVDAFYGGLEWSPDGNQLAFIAGLPTPARDPRAPWEVGRCDGEGYGYLPSRLHLWTIDLDSGKLNRLTSGDYHHGAPQWTPDGRQIIFVSNRSGDEGPVSSSINKNYDLWSVPASGGEPRQLTTNPGPDVDPRVSPNGRFVAYRTTPRCGSHHDDMTLAVLALESGEIRHLETPGSVAALGLQCWSADSANVYCSVDLGINTCPCKVALDGSPAVVLTEGDCCTGPPAVAATAQLAWVVSTPLSPPELRVNRQTNINRMVADRDYGDVRSVRWQSDEFEIEGIVIEPPRRAASERSPLIVIPHGGPHSRANSSFDAGFQLLAAQGYLLLLPNFRGSSGYGQAFVDADRGDFGGGDFRDLMRGIDKLIADGQADPERIGIYGRSYGGFMTTWAIGNSTRFRAAVAGCSVTNLQSMFGTTDIRDWTGWEMYGYPWEQPELYRRCSPISYVDRVATPTLLLHGEADLRVPISQSAEFHAALEMRGVPTSFVRYPGEGHPIATTPSHVRDLWQRVLAWFARYLPVND